MKINGISSNKYILVGAKADGDTVQQYGGVLTLSNSLADFAHKFGFEVEIINTLRSGFEHQSLLTRAKAGLTRVNDLVSFLRVDKPVGVVIFSGAGWSFYERIAMAFICRIFCVRCVFFIVDGWFLGVKKAYWLKRIWIGLLLKIPSKLAASGSNWRKSFLEFGVKDERIITIHYWLPRLLKVATKPKVAMNRESISFIFVGWMIKEKGVHEILASLEILLKKYKFNFTFIGGGTLLEEVQQRISTLRWGSSVMAYGWMSPDQVDNELSSADVFVLPSYAEGFPLSLIEAMAKGLPAICTDVGGISDSLHDGVNGLLIAPRDIFALTKAMEFYVCNPDAVSEHSLKTLNIVRANHDADNNCELLFNCFKDVR